MVRISSFEAITLSLFPVENGLVGRKDELRGRLEILRGRQRAVEANYLAAWRLPRQRRVVTALSSTHCLSQAYLQCYCFVCVTL